jgi:hypothetical protein
MPGQELTTRTVVRGAPPDFLPNNQGPATEAKLSFPPIHLQIGLHAAFVALAIAKMTEGCPAFLNGECEDSTDRLKERAKLFFGQRADNPSRVKPG